MIPRIIHQVWVGADSMPEAFRDYQESWRRHHPDWEMHLWTEENLPTDLVRTEAYERLRNPAERSDIIRLEVLYRFGGVYVDTDVECLRPIDPLLDEGASFFAGYIGPKHVGPKKLENAVNNAIIAAEARHPVLERALRELRPVTAYGVDKHGTGPWFLTELLSEHPEVTIHAQELFYPSTDAERASAYTIHHDAASWKTADVWKERALRERQKLAEARDWNEQLEALVGLRGPAAGIRAWRTRLLSGGRLRRAARRARD